MASDFVPRPASGLAHRNVMHMFAARVRRSAEQPALRFKQDGAWRTLSWRAWQQQARALAAGLHTRGIRPGDRVALLARTGPRWVLADLAIAMAGAISVPVYPSLAPDQAVAIIADAGATALLVDDALALGGLQPLLPAHVGVAVVMHGAHDGPPSDSAAVTGWDALAELGRDRLADDSGTAGALDALADREVGPDDPMTFVYTSGATGEPKGAVLTHRNLMYEAWALKNVVPVDHTDEQLMVLPLAHIFARHLVWATVEQGAVTAFATDESEVYAAFREIAPTFVAAVPRMYERAHASMRQLAAARGGVGRAMFERAIEVGRRASFYRQRGQPLPTALRLQHSVADRAVLRGIRARFGGRIRFFVSGGAPLSTEVAELFHAADLLILEGYGLSETTGATHVNRPDRYRFGSVGPALPGCETQIADDGEILIRGPNVMARYHNRPEQTAQVLDADGWLHTGDVGELRDGFLRITDRKKDLLKTSTGKYVAPLVLEKHLRLCPGIGYATVCGDARPHVVALVSLDEEALLAQSDREGFGCTTYADLAAHPGIRRQVQAHVDEVNRGLSRHERIRGIYIVPQPFTEATGELTPTRKVKRAVVVARYADAIAALYQRPEPDPARTAR